MYTTYLDRTYSTGLRNKKELAWNIHLLCFDTCGHVIGLVACWENIFCDMTRDWSKSCWEWMKSMLAVTNQREWCVVWPFVWIPIYICCISVTLARDKRNEIIIFQFRISSIHPFIWTWWKCSHDYGSANHIHNIIFEAIAIWYATYLHW